MRVLRVYHGGRDSAHRERDRRLAAAGIELTLVVPAAWPGSRNEVCIGDERFPIAELDVRRSGDVNRHVYADVQQLKRVVLEVQPELVDVHEEPVSLASRQWLASVPAELPVVMYTAQNVDKRYPPPFAWYERRALGRADALYPCSRQAAAVVRGKGFAGLIDVIPLGFDPELFRPGTQSLEDDELVFGFFGRFVPEKGLQDAVRVVALVSATRPARLVACGTGPDESAGRALAASLGVADRLEILPWQGAERVARIYRTAHAVLVPSVATATWTEQFGRVIVEAQASGAVVAGYSSGSIPEVAGEAAVLVEPGDPEALAKAVLRVLGDPADFGRRREAGMAAAAERTWGAVARRQSELYRRVVAREWVPVDLPTSPSARRARAREEFGSSAPTTAGARPFALPMLRRGGVVASGLENTFDGLRERWPWPHRPR